MVIRGGSAVSPYQYSVDAADKNAVLGKCEAEDDESRKPAEDIIIVTMSPYQDSADKDAVLGKRHGEDDESEPRKLTEDIIIVAIRGGGNAVSPYQDSVDAAEKDAILRRRLAEGN